jgi:hypothetical protein
MVQEYLKTHTLDDLRKELNIRIEEHPDGRVQLNYDQLDTPRAHPIAVECRGLILERDTWRVVAQGFHRFFNLGDPVATPLDWNHAWAEEKVDGSLVLLYRYNDEWRVSTRGSIDAGGGLPQKPETTFSEAIWPLIQKNRLDIDRCYVLEFISQWNRVVTRYKEPGLVLLTVRCGGEEVSVEEADFEADFNHWRRPRRYDISNGEDLAALLSCETAADATREGFVVVDRSLNRVKVKTNTYVQLHKTLNNGTPDYWSMIARNEAAQFLSVFPEYTVGFSERRIRLAEATDSASDLWLNYRLVEDQKTFAMAVKHHPLSPVLFQMRKKGLADAVFRDYLWEGLTADEREKLFSKRI